MAFQYFDADYAIKVHDFIIEKTGGLKGITNSVLLESALGHIQNDTYYGSLEEKATHLLYSINKNHCFRDGNKRASIALTAYFLEVNGFDFLVRRFMIEMENITVDVAEDRIDKELLFEIIDSIINEQDYSEGLKIKIINAKCNNDF